jgi:hypothetical protein
MKTKITCLIVTPIVLGGLLGMCLISFAVKSVLGVRKTKITAV